MADLFSRSFHCLAVPCRSLQPKHSEKLRISAPIPLSKRWVRVTHHTRMLPNSTSPSSFSPNSVPEDFVILSSTECSDGSVVFRFGNASEIREKIGELDQEKLTHEDVEEGGKAGARALLSEGVEKLNTEVDHNLVEEIESSSTVVVGDVLSEGVENLNSKVDHNLGEEIESSSTAVVGVLSEGVEKLNAEVDHNLGEGIECSSAVVVNVADQNLQLPVNEKESVVLDNDSETNVINESQKIGRHLKLDSVEDALHGILSEGVAAEGNGVPSVSEEDSEVDSHEEVVVSTVTPDSHIFSDLNSGASGEVEEKEEADKGHGEDRGTNNLTGGGDADLSELMPASTSLESEQVANDEETTHHIVDESNNASEMAKSAMLHDVVQSSNLENKIDVGNTERNDYENPPHPTVPEIHSVETASNGEKISGAELLLISGAACLPHPSKVERMAILLLAKTG